MKCKCKKPMPWDNGDCSKCGKPTGKGLLIKKPQGGMDNACSFL